MQNRFTVVLGAGFALFGATLLLFVRADKPLPP